MKTPPNIVASLAAIDRHVSLLAREASGNGAGPDVTRNVLRSLTSDLLLLHSKIDEAFTPR